MGRKGLVEERLLQIVSVTYTGRHFEEGITI